LSYRVHFSKDGDSAALRKRYQDAFEQARRELNTIRPGAAPDQGFDKLFRQKLAVQGGQPSDALTVAFLSALPGDLGQIRNADFNIVYDQALESVRAQLENRFKELFAQALRGEEPVGDSMKKTTTHDARRVAIARLLIGLAPVLAEDEVTADGGRAEDKA